MRKRTALILLVLVLIGAALNFPVAMWCAKSRLKVNSADTLVIAHGADAKRYSWPVRGPHQWPWPELNYYRLSHDFGYRAVHATGEAVPGSAHIMQAEFMGWPLPCVARVQMWWPWNDPAWESTAEPDPKPRVYWLGALLNPLIFGLSLWLLLVAPLELFVAARRRSRWRRGACERCGYPRGRAGVCTECGAPTGAVASF
jgi:hypothetical protein